METTHKIQASFFSEFLKPGHIVYELQARTKVDALDELLELLHKHKHIDNKKLLLTRIIDRERLETTAIGDGIALPHARVNAGGDLTVAVGRSEKGLDFDAGDRGEV